MPGLGLLPTVTVFSSRKETYQVRGLIVDDPHCPGGRGQVVEGYEIHMGQTSGGKPWLELTRPGNVKSRVKDGASTDDGTVWGCYLHGLFGNDDFRRRWLNSLSQRFGLDAVKHGMQEEGGPVQRVAADLDVSLNRLANHVEAALDRERLEQIVWNPTGTYA
jgi:adenosylcobyric acid synthase